MVRLGGLALRRDGGGGAGGVRVASFRGGGGFRIDAICRYGLKCLNMLNNLIMLNNYTS